MKFGNLKQDKGVAGTTVLLSLIVSLFVIGLLVMIFALMGGSLRGSSAVAASESETVEDTSLTVNDGGTTLTTCNAAVEGSTTAIVSVYNVSGSVLIASGNYTLTTPCTITAVGTEFNNTAWNVTYTYTYAGEAYGVINDTTLALADATDFFDLFIVIGSMVVLILLTVIIIVAIRQSGMLSGGTA